jgi:hypothetical protein
MTNEKVQISNRELVVEGIYNLPIGLINLLP